MKIIIILRDPVERAYSHYLMDVREGTQLNSFYEALREDWARETKGWYVSHLYVELGCYGRQIRRYLELFGKEQVGIFTFEELRRQPTVLLRKLFAFLEVDPDCAQRISTDTVHNAFAAPRSKVTQRLMGQGHLRKTLRTVLPPRLRSFIRHKLLFKKESKLVLDPRAVAFLNEIDEPEIYDLEQLLGQSCHC